MTHFYSAITPPVSRPAALPLLPLCSVQGHHHHEANEEGGEGGAGQEATPGLVRERVECRMDWSAGRVSDCSQIRPPFPSAPFRRRLPLHYRLKHTTLHAAPSPPVTKPPHAACSSPGLGGWASGQTQESSSTGSGATSAASCRPTKTWEASRAL